MSRFFSAKYKNLRPYDTAGEQPQDMSLVKLNTNESPFPPSPRAVERINEAAGTLYRYSDPDCGALTAKLAELLDVRPGEILFTNGSDEILDFAFMAFCDEKNPAAFPDITYSFYKVLAGLNGVNFKEIPLQGDFTVCIDDYIGLNRTVFLANPNAPTGLALPVSEIERLIQGSPDNLIVVDEAYVDFGTESCVPLIHRYKNLLVTQTFSKSRSLAGARLGFGVACEELIRDLKAVKNSASPYNVNSLTLAAGLGTLEDEETYTRPNCRAIQETRTFTAGALKELGFTMTDSVTNFLFARHPGIDGKELYLRLRERGILIRHFDTPALAQYNRITIGSREQMQELLNALREILKN